MSRFRDVRRSFERVACFGLALLVWTTPALACPVCFSAKENVLPAFYGTALLLTVLPFVLVGSVGYGVHRHVRRHHASVDGEQD